MRLCSYIPRIGFWITLLSSISLHAQEYIPTGPSETAEFEEGLFHCTSGGETGIWPSTETLKNAVPADKLPREYVQELEAWLARVLRPQFKPSDSNAVEWIGIRNLHWNYNFIIGRWNIPQLEATVEVQAQEDGISVTVTSAGLLNKRASEMTDEDIRNYAALVLAVPEEKVKKTEVEKRIKEIAGTPVCFGQMRCEWSERSGEAQPHWWSGISFWSIQGKLFLGFGMAKQEPLRATVKHGTERWRF